MNFEKGTDVLPLLNICIQPVEVNAVRKSPHHLPASTIWWVGSSSSKRQSNLQVNAIDSSRSSTAALVASAPCLSLSNVSAIHRCIHRTVSPSLSTTVPWVTLPSSSHISLTDRNLTLFFSSVTEFSGRDPFKIPLRGAGASSPLLATCQYELSNGGPSRSRHASSLSIASLNLRTSRVSFTYC
ncbi:hypothetical protein K491DRAFT_115444 [Lophiostoma macrostomum CBS 122681]|uniref:Uncharacterized protein n=1 Tax=Lophiostoma macrostomum CBS 122681 TaxID=1314788 RepID=A0A6A6STL6_9PLEO|nr:hypothetical protein K491DRAFT_115444 [Lophiostoma macrostomum CBS 122681]